MKKTLVCISVLLCLAITSVNAALMQDFVIYGTQDVVIGVGSTVTGLVGSGNSVIGDTQLNGTAGVYGDVRSGNTVSLANNAFVTGTVTNPGTFTLGSGAWVGAHVVAVPDLPSLPAASVFTSGVTDQSVANSQTMNLAPGSYRNISLGGACTLNLSAGDYFLNSLTSGNSLDLNINLAGGNKRIFVAGSATLGSVDVFLTGGTAVNVYVETQAITNTNNYAFTAGGSSNWLGTVFAPNGGITIGSGSSTGTFVGHLWADQKVYIQHNIDGSVPEPATLALLGLSAMALLRARRS